MPVRFNQYLPLSGAMITSQVGDHCDAEVQDYLQNHQRSGTKITRDLCRNALNCILDSLDPTTTSNLQSANVLLGITPTMLSLLGNSSAEVALLSFSGRPLLVFLLSVGAPVLSVTGTFKLLHPLEVIKSPEGRSPFPKFPRSVTIVLLFAEYILSAGAAVDVALLAYDISSKAVYVPNCGRTWYAFLWMYLCLILYPLGLFTFASRVRVKRAKSRAWISNEIKHCANHTGTTFVMKEESYRFIFSDWVLSHGAIIQIIFGTMTLSSTTLINVPDAFRIAGRYAASAILCRLILMYELYGLRAAVAAGAVGVVDTPRVQDHEYGAPMPESFDSINMRDRKEAHTVSEERA